MTILSVCQDVCKDIGLDVPSAIIGQTERELVELVSTVNKIIPRLVKAHEWELLLTLATITGDAATTAWPLEADYDRMPTDMALWSSSLQTPLTHITSQNEWLGLSTYNFNYVINAWIKFGGNINIQPALALGVTATYYYISNAAVAPSTGSNKATWTLDTDTFRIDEELLRLAMIWTWKAKKGRPYAEDMEDYNDRLGQLITEDKGSKITHVGRARYPSGVNVAWPGVITS